MIIFVLVVPKERMSSRLFLHVGKNCLLCIAIVYYLSNNECIIIKHSVFWWFLHRLLVSQCLNLFNISPGISTFLSRKTIYYLISRLFLCTTL